jgi:hypothetical protein
MGRMSSLTSHPITNKKCYLSNIIHITVALYSPLIQPLYITPWIVFDTFMLFMWWSTSSVLFAVSSPYDFPRCSFDYQISADNSAVAGIVFMQSVLVTYLHYSHSAMLCLCYIRMYVYASVLKLLQT